MKLISLMLFLFSMQAWAQVPDKGVDRQIYARLMEDFYEEILTMDAVQEAQAEREKAIELLRAAMQSENPNVFRFEDKKTWSLAWPVQTKAFQQRPPALIEKYQSIDPGLENLLKDQHSIQNLNGYLRARLGSQAATLIAESKVGALVLGGSETSVQGFLKVSKEKLFKLPSLYESWGLQRFYVSASAFADQKPRVIYLVPPAREYLEHYHLMLFHLTGQKSPVYRLPADYEKWKQGLAEGVQFLGRKLGGRFDYVTLGYFNQWPEAIRRKSTILGQTELSLPSGHRARYIRFKNNEGSEFRLLTLGHDRTIWGEASAHLLSGALEFRPRGIIFLGSAGSLSEKTKVYEISAPLKFRTKQAEVEVSNFVQLGKVQSQNLAVSAKFDAIHGNTSSPAAQTISYLQKHQQKGTDTIDVEQSLIAEMIAQHNKTHSTKIHFGAVNLITDKPLGHAENDLDRIDEKKKYQARLAAVDLALQSLLIEKKNPIQCSRAH